MINHNLHSDCFSKQKSNCKAIFFYHKSAIRKKEKHHSYMCMMTRRWHQEGAVYSWQIWSIWMEYLVAIYRYVIKSRVRNYNTTQFMKRLWPILQKESTARPSSWPTLFRVGCVVLLLGPPSVKKYLLIFVAHINKQYQ